MRFIIKKDRFKIFSLNDIDKIINKTLNLIYKYGLNYIEKYSNIKSIDNLYNENLIYKLLILNKYKKTQVIKLKSFIQLTGE